MKILYLCADPGIPVLGRKGASVHVRELCDAFARGGHRVTLAAHTLNKFPADESAHVRARVIHVPSDPAATAATQAFKDFNERLGLENSLPGELRRILYNEAIYQNLKRRFLRHRPAFIYERAALHATAGVRLAAKFKVPHIVELNAPLAVEQVAYRATGFGELAARAERWTLTNADAVVVVSKQLGAHVKSLGVPAQIIHVMPNGVNPELFYPNATKRGCPSRAPRPTLGFVGVLRPWHGVEILPELLARLRHRHRNVRLIIAGDGPLKSELKRKFAKRGLEHNVVFTGLLDHEAIPALIRQFDVALAPYPKHDHDFYFSPLKLFEYMACGVAVAVPKVGQIAEVIQHRRTGLLYRPGDLDGLTRACDRLLGDPALRLALGQAAARVVLKRYTWDRNAANVIELAKSLAARARTR